MTTIDFDTIIDAVRERIRSKRIELPIGLVVVSRAGTMVGRFDLRWGKVQFTLRKGHGDIMTAPVDLALVDKRGRVHRFKFLAEDVDERERFH